MCIFSTKCILHRTQVIFAESDYWFIFCNMNTSAKLKTANTLCHTLSNEILRVIWEMPANKYNIINVCFLTKS